MITLMERARGSAVLGQLIRFGLVGGFVTALGAVAYLASALAGIHPLLANVIAYLVAMATGYVLHSKVSFRGHGSRDKAGLRTARFFTVNTLGFLLNQFFVWYFVRYLGGPIWWSVIPIVVFTPLVTFALNRRWVFG